MSMGCSLMKIQVKHFIRRKKAKILSRKIMQTYWKNRLLMNFCQDSQLSHNHRISGKFKGRKKSQKKGTQRSPRKPIGWNGQRRKSSP